MHKNSELFDPADSIEKAFNTLAPEVKERMKTFNFEQQVTLIPPAEGEARTGTFVPSRNFSDDLCYGVGFSYLTGAIAGSVWGLWHGLRMPLPTKSLPVRYTTILNQLTSKGPFLANRLGSIVTIYNISRASLTELGLNNNLSTVIGSIFSGAVVRAPYGLKASVSSAGVCGVAGLTWLFINRLNKKD
eukprot:NODE_476_length_7980_cov_0.328258.p4 type:complete len:188 gc:universal NODE_476_length_7980_cov_0.328258:6851-6288(-)